MKVIVSIISIWVLLKNISYAIYEYKTNKNVVGAITVAALNIICFIFLNVVLLLN